MAAKPKPVKKLLAQFYKQLADEDDPAVEVKISVPEGFSTGEEPKPRPDVALVCRKLPTVRFAENLPHYKKETAETAATVATTATAVKRSSTSIALESMDAMLKRLKLTDKKKTTE